MAGRIRKDDIETLRERADIAEVVGDYTTLKRAGQRMKGLCPFHQEKTPSFTVDTSRNLFHCFGCGEGGDIYSFLMRIEGLDFSEAVERLARRTGYTLTYEEMSAGEKRALGERSKLVAVNEDALEFFRTTLFGDDGEVARDYLKSRGFGRSEADTFELGYAPNTWDALSRKLQADGYDQRTLTRVGIAAQNDRGGLRDRFRGRLIFPIRDVGGDVIGFGGRILPGLDYGDFDPPKYLNTPETPLYHKTKVLYGVTQARPEIHRSGQVLVCEGYTDVMALHQAGVENAVATCGTAVGDDHFRLLARNAERVVLAFDADEAGATAAERAWNAARPHGLDVRVLVLPDGQDPADVVRAEGGVERLRQLVADAIPVVPFVIRRTIAGYELSSESGRTAALKAAVELLGQVEDPDLRREYARTEVADGIGVSIEFVAATASRANVTLDRHAGVAATRQPQQSRTTSGSVDARRARLEREVLRIALQDFELLPEAWQDAAAEDFTHPTARAVFVAMAGSSGTEPDLDDVLAAAPDDDVRGVIRGIALEEPEVDPDAEHAATLVNRLLLPRLEADLETRKAELARLNPSADYDAYRRQFAELAQLENRRRELGRGST